jgi:hypothetical protein
MSTSGGVRGGNREEPSYSILKLEQRPIWVPAFARTTLRSPPGTRIFDFFTCFFVGTAQRPQFRPLRRFLHAPLRGNCGASLRSALLSFLIASACAAADKPEPAGPPPPPEKWSEAEVAAARADCARRLSGQHVLSEMLGPIREGMCGTPAPLRLKGFEYGAERALTFEPEPVVSCRLAEAMSRWTAEAVQPEARKHLQTRIVGMVTVASYNCRSRYGDQNQRLSEHAYVNALDVSEFVTEKGERIAIEGSWKAGDERAGFLHAIHEGACRIFGTALGPEANDAHRNHFHLDMKERRQPLCDFSPEQIKAREEAKKHPPPPQPEAAKPR